MDESRGPFRFTECAMCGKKFIRHPGYIYSLKFGGTVHHFCSYNCYEKGRRTKESKNSNAYTKLRRELKGENNK